MLNPGDLVIYHYDKRIEESPFECMDIQKCKELDNSVCQIKNIYRSDSNGCYYSLKEFPKMAFHESCLGKIETCIDKDPDFECLIRM